jgi:hypothetical protein
MTYLLWARFALLAAFAGVSGLLVWASWKDRG